MLRLWVPRLEADGRAARPKDLFILHGARGQVVGRGGGEPGRFFSWIGRVLCLPMRDFLLCVPEVGVGGKARTWTDTL